MAKEKLKAVQFPSAKSEDQPATRKMLRLVRDEVCQRMDAGFSSLRSEIHGIKGEVHGLKSEIHELRADVKRIEESSTRTHLLIEEQRADNRIVLEALQGLWQRQERLEKRQ